MGQTSQVAYCASWSSAATEAGGRRRQGDTFFCLRRLTEIFDNGTVINDLNLARRLIEFRFLECVLGDASLGVSWSCCEQRNDKSKQGADSKKVSQKCHAKYSFERVMGVEVCQRIPNLLGVSNNGLKIARQWLPALSPYSM
jgi:hypothetical protein